MELQVLGPLRLLGDGEPLRVGGPQIERVLAALLIERGGTVSAESLTRVLWGEDAPPTASRTLRTYITRLRRVLTQAGVSGELVRAEGGGYVLGVGEEHVDADRFEGLIVRAKEGRAPGTRVRLLTRALGMWRGRAFGDLADEDFFQLEAQRLEELRRATTEEWFEARLAVGDHATLVPEMEIFVSRHPFRERVWGQLMRALYLDDRQADALEAYARCRAILGEELGLEPSGSLQLLEDQILTGTLDEQPLADRPAVELPSEVDSFVGRDDEVDAVVAALGSVRLLTVVGVAGVGKTRLARRVAASVDFPDGVCWADLSTTSHPSEVAPAVVDATGAPISPGSGMEEGLLAHLRPREMLLVLDNCEHLLDPLSELVDAIVSRTNVTVLATSRSALRVRGEALFPLSLLPVTAGDAEEAPSVRLFLDRAEAVRPDALRSDEDREAVAAICRRLDGLPLAIELAAARVRSLDPGDILDRLDRRFSLLSDGPRTYPDRHRSLQAAIDWSFDLLSGTERRLLQRLSVFPGTFTLEALEAICAGGAIARDEIVSLLSGLVDHSLVSVETISGETRYRLLETIRAYAGQHLEASTEQAAVVDAYTAFYLEFARQADLGLRGSEEGWWVRRIKEELPNLRHVFSFAWQSDDTETVLRLTVALSLFARWRLHKETLEWAERAATLPGARRHPLFPEAAGAGGWSLALRGARAEAVEIAREGLDRLDDVTSEAVLAREVLAHVALWEGRLEECRRHREDSERLGDQALTFVLTEVDCLASVYGHRLEEAWRLWKAMEEVAQRTAAPSDLSLVEYARGEALVEEGRNGAEEAFGAAMRHALEADNRIVMGVAGASRSSQLVRQGDPLVAIAPFLEVIDTLWQAQDWAHLWTALRSLVDLLVRLGEHEVAAQLHGAVLHSATASPVFGSDAERLRTLGNDLASRLGAERAEALQRRGRHAADDEIVSRVRATLVNLQPA